MKWYWQLIIYLIIGAVLINATTIYGFLKYKIWWEFNRDWVEFTLNPIWKKAGLIEIYGGAETGKTLLITLLTLHLKGRKWSNVPNTISGWQYLKIPTLKKHWAGEFERGLVGVNNVLLIDESWNFFSQHNLVSHGLGKDSLSKLLNFMTETSKTGWKVFYVTKKGVRLPEAHRILNANNSAIIRVLGTRRFCEYWGRKFYFLDIEFITDPRKFNYALREEKDNLKYAIKNNDHQLKETPTKPWWKWIFNPFASEKQKVISIPFTHDELSLYDKTWNLDSEYARNRMISIVNELGADGLVEGLKYKQSRVQRIQEENKALAYFEKHPDKKRREQLRFKGKEVAKQRGLWKSAEEQIEQEEKELKNLFEKGKVSLTNYKEKNAKLVERKQKLAEVMGKQQIAQEIANAEQATKQKKLDEIPSGEEEEKKEE